MGTTHKDPFLGTDLRRARTRTQQQTPPVYLEYAWYASIAYATLGQVLGVVIPIIGGALLVLVTAACVYHVGDRVFQVYAPVKWALGTVASVIVITIIFYDERAVEGSYIFVTWLCTMVIAQTLSLRPGLLQRFACVAFAIGLGALPFMTARNLGGITRVWGAGGISNPNVLGMWFGLCAVFFLFWGLQSRKTFERAVSWVLAVGCLYVILLSVSRGAILAVMVACIVGLRSVLQRYFIPLLLLVLLLWGVYESGVFQPLIDQFVTRGAEKSGREKLWAMGLERLLDSPWIGVGLHDMKMPLSGHRYANPHNGLLHIALAAGILPLICYLVYLARVGAGTLRMIRRPKADQDVLLPPLVAFALLQIMVGDYNFMSAWVVVVFALATVRQSPKPQRQLDLPLIPLTPLEK